MANKVPTATAKAHHEVYNLKSRYIAVKIVIFCLFSVSLPDFHHQTNSLFSQWIFFFLFTGMQYQQQFGVAALLVG